MDRARVRWGYFSDMKTYDGFSRRNWEVDDEHLSDWLSDFALFLLCACEIIDHSRRKVDIDSREEAKVDSFTRESFSGLSFILHLWFT